MLRAFSAGFLVLLFLSGIDGDAFFSRKIPTLRDPLEATNPLVASHQEALKVQEPQFKRIVKKVKADEDESSDDVARSLKAARVSPIEDDQRKAATRTLGAIVSANVESAVTDKHLESVAKSMKTVIATKIQNSNHGFFRGPQSHLPRGIQAKVVVKVDHISKPVAKSIKLEAEDASSQENVSTQGAHSLASVAKTMKAVVAKVESQQEGQSVIQGFKVQGDPSNKIVFLDLEALKSSGISLDSSRISLGSSGLGKNLRPIDGLEASSPNFQSIVEQKLEADHQAAEAHHRQRIPIQPAVAHHQRVPIQPEAHHYQRVPIQPEARHHQRISIQPEARHHQRISIQPEAHHHQRVSIQPEAHHHQRVSIQPEAHYHQRVSIQPEAHYHQRIPIQPAVAVKQVSASQGLSGGHQVALGSRITVPTAEIAVIRPQTNAGSNASQRQSLFFGKYQGRNNGKLGKPSTPTNHHQASPTATVHQPGTQEGRILSGNHQRGGEASQPAQQKEGHDDHHPQLHFKHFGFGGV